MSGGNRDRDARAIARGFDKRQREFDNRDRDRADEAARRQRLGLPDIDQEAGPHNSPAALRSDALRRIRGEPSIGHTISEFLPDAHDRSRLNLADAGSFVDVADRDALCLPTGTTFRTNPDPTTGGCGPFAAADALQCCEQSDLEFCADVAAIMRGRVRPITNNRGGRIAREILKWMTTYRLNMIPPTKQVSVNTSLEDDRQALKLAILVETSVTLNIMVNHPNENLDVGLGDVRGHVHVRASVPGASVSFASVRDIANKILRVTKLVIHCDIEMGTLGADDVVRLLNRVRYRTIGVTELEFPLPVGIPVESLGPLLIDLGVILGVNWVDRPRRHDGPIWRDALSLSATRFVAVGYDLRDNRVNVRIQR